MAPFIMKLTGEASIPKTAERAIIDLEVSSSNESYQKASEEVTNTAKELQKLLRQYSPVDSSDSAKASAAIVKWAMGKMVTSSHMEKLLTYTTEYTRVYTAKVNFNIRVRDFTKLGTLAQKFSQTPHVKIERTYWILTQPTRKAYQSELRKLAAADALQRAEDYAATLGLKKVTPVELKEQAYTDGTGSVRPVHFYGPGMGGSLPFGAAAHMQQQQMQTQQQTQVQNQADAGDGGVDLFFEPDEIQLMLRIDCTFAAE